MSGRCACNHCAMNWALNERGLERKPCKYTMCVVFAEVISKVAWVKKSLNRMQSAALFGISASYPNSCAFSAIKLGVFDISSQTKIVSRLQVRDFVAYRQPVLATLHIGTDVKGVRVRL